MTLSGDFFRIFRIGIPAVLTLAVLDALIVALCVHANWADSSQSTLLFLRDAGWNSAILLVPSSVLAAGGAVLLRGLPGRMGIDAPRIATLAAIGLSALLGLVAIHHYLEASVAEPSTRPRVFVVYGTWILGVLGLTVFRAPVRVHWARPVLAVLLVAALPLLLGVWVDTADGRKEHSARVSLEPDGYSLTDTIVLVTLDTTRFDAVGYSNSGRTETPVLDRLAREGAAYTQATTPTPLTLPSHTSMMTGRSPWDHGVVVNGCIRFGTGR